MYHFRRTIILGIVIISILSAMITPLRTVSAFPSGQGTDPETKARRLLASMTPEQKVGQLFLVAFRGTDVGEESKIYNLITRYGIGGVVLRSDNDNFIGPEGTIKSASEMIDSLQSHAWNASPGGSLVNPATNQPLQSAYIPLFVGISQEGDSYPYDQILNGMTPLPTNMAIGATWKPELAEQIGTVLGRELSSIGFNLFLGPSLDVLDMVQPSGGDDLGARTFGGDPYWVGQMGTAYIRGLHTGGDNKIAVIAKHFPGRGGSDRLPEEEVATVRKLLEQLKQIELEPFFAVTQESEDLSQQTDGLLVSHIRYQGFQGNIRDTTAPVSLDKTALEQILAIQPIADWYQKGGVVVSDSLGSNAIRKFFDPTLQSFDSRQIALDAFLAGNDLLYLNNFYELIDPDSATTIVRTLESFTQKYREDTAFAERVDRSVLKILALKYKLYPAFTLEAASPDLQGLDEVGRSQAVSFEVARQSVTLISPDPAELSTILQRPPSTRDQMVFFTDTITAKQCNTCVEQSIFPVDGLKNAVVRLYGPQAGGQINQNLLSTYTFADLQVYLNDPNSSPPLDNNLRGANWVVFSMLSMSESRPESLALKRLLSERPDLIRNKRVIVFAFNAPYYLDATDISKITAYYGIYGKTTPFLDMAARILFQELQPTGALPVSVMGVGYDLILATSPDPSQVIPLMIDQNVSEVLDGTQTPEPTEAPKFKIGDVIPIKTGVIYDHNRNMVPDGTIVNFFITSSAEGNIVQQIGAETVGGVAKASYRINSPTNLDIRVEADLAVTSQILRLSVENGQEAAITAIVPTLPVTETVEPTPTITPTVMATPQNIDLDNTKPGFGDWFISTIMIWGLGFGILWIGRLRVSFRWGVRWGLLAVVGGMFAFLYLSLIPSQTTSWFILAGTPGVMLATLFGVLSGWGIGYVWHLRLKLGVKNPQK